MAPTPGPDLIWGAVSFDLAALAHFHLPITPHLHAGLTAAASSILQVTHQFGSIALPLRLSVSLVVMVAAQL